MIIILMVINDYSIDGYLLLLIYMSHVNLLSVFLK
jgi:hypothetical protein